MKSTDVWAQTAGTRPAPASAGAGILPALNSAAGAAASLPLRSGLLLGDTDVTCFCPSHRQCWAAGVPAVGAERVLTERGVATPPRLGHRASSERGSRALPTICLFSRTLVFGSFVLGCVSVPKATRHGSWNSGRG